MQRAAKFLIVVMFSVLSAIPANAQSAQPAIGTEAAATQMIAFFLEELDTLRTTLDGVAQGERGGWFSKGEQDFRADLDAVLDTALDMIAADEHAHRTLQIDQIDAALLEARALRVELRIRLTTATVSDGVRMVDRLLLRDHRPGSQADLTARLAQVETAIATLLSEREDAVTGFASDLQDRYAITLTRDQADAALLSVHGGLMLDSAVVLRTLVVIERRLNAGLSEGLTSETARRYYGVASATRLVHARMLARHLEAYDTLWLPRLSALRHSTAELLRETQAGAEATTQEQARATFLRNAQTQTRLLDVIAQYDTVLQARRMVTQTALEDATQRADAAINTLRTLNATGSVMRLIEYSHEDFAVLGTLDIPQLNTLEDAEIVHFRDISRYLQSEI